MIKFPFFAALALSGSLAVHAQTWGEAPPRAADIINEMHGVPPASDMSDDAPKKPTALQTHLSFFDKNNDGTVTRAETTLSLQQLGLSPREATNAAFLIHLVLGPKTTGSWRSLDISVKTIKLAKHGSDTGAFDADGRFVPAAFERMFAEFDVNRSNSLSEVEISNMIVANAKLRPGDTTAAKKEFQLLMKVAADTTEDAGGKRIPAITRQRLQEFYDGSLFFTLAKLAKPA